MLLIERETKILDILNRRGVISVRDLAEYCSVTEVTIRRDLKRLEGLNLLRRTHGGAVRLDGSANHDNDGSGEAIAAHTDALILAPVQNRYAHTLRERALRNGIPLLAESSPQEGAIYLGPNNFEASVTLGRWTGEYIRKHLSRATILDITQLQLENTRARSAGFIEGIHHVLGDRVEIITVNGQALYNDAYQVAIDALRLHPRINVIFGINDDCVLAGMQAYSDLGYDLDNLLAVNVGGEGKTILDTLAEDGPLKACLALFPEVVGRMAVDAVLRLWAGETGTPAVITPSALLTKDNLHQYYTHTRSGWELIPNALGDVGPIFDPPPRRPELKNKRLSFVIHYRTHEWYQNVARAMRTRASEAGITFTVADVNEDFRAEIRDLRRLIGKLAVSYINDGDTIILDTGTTTSSMAQFLRGYQDLTVITNSIDVFQRLQPSQNIRLIMTGGEYDPESRSFVGRGARLLLEEIRADKVFLVAGGVSTSFGISSVTMQETEIRRSMIEAAREVIVLADHTVLDVESNFRVAGLDVVDTLITDAGVLSAQSMELSQHGIKVIVAGRVSVNS
jgi:DeoR/GlpR family transcriptional regulator of sugar metabolism/DNA-binding LacI/PurR family transcriptional regulator